MASYNRIIMIGNLTRDPDLKPLTSGQTVCRFGLASNRQFKNRQTGTMTQEVCFVDVDVWGPQAESCKQYLQKGKSVLVEGRLKLDSWEDNGTKRSKHYIVADRVTFLSSSTSAQDEVGSEESSDSFSFQDQSSNTVMGAESKKKVTREVKAKDPVRPSAAQDFTTNIGEINFKSEEPFDDELPF